LRLNRPDQIGFGLDPLSAAADTVGTVELYELTEAIVSSRDEGAVRTNNDAGVLGGYCLRCEARDRVHDEGVE